MTPGVAAVRMENEQRRVGGAKHTAGGAGAGISSLQRLLVASLAEIIRASVDDNGAL